MQTRVGRHNYDEDVINNGGRTSKNKELYNVSYSTDDIKIPKVSTARELDEEEFQKIINQSHTRTMRVITKEDIKKYEEQKEEENKEEVEEQNYDINSVLENAKNKRKDTSDKYSNASAFQEYKPIVEEKEDDDNMELLADLMGSDDTVFSDKSEINIVVDKDDDEDYSKDLTDTKIDSSFYSKSLRFEHSDFIDDKSKEDKKYSKFQIVITVVIVLLLIVAVVLGVMILGGMKF